MPPTILPNVFNKIFALFLVSRCTEGIGQRHPASKPPSMTDPLPSSLLSVHDLACERSERLLFQRMNFSLASGQLLLVQGGNGQGKTSLLRLLTGLSRPDAGEVRWRGEPITRCRDAYYRDMAYLGHANGIKDELNPVENVWQFLRQNHLANRVWETYDDIVHACCDAWNALINEPGRIASIASRTWATVSI